MFQSNNNLTHTDTMYKPNNVLIHLQNKSRDGSDKTILKRDNTNNIDKTKAKDYGKETIWLLNVEMLFLLLDLTVTLL